MQVVIATLVGKISSGLSGEKVAMRKPY